MLVLIIFPVILQTVIILMIEWISTGWSKKMAQSLLHHNFATVHHRVMRFSAKCFERNSLHD